MKLLKSVIQLLAVLLVGASCTTSPGRVEPATKVGEANRTGSGTPGSQTSGGHASAIPGMDFYDTCSKRRETTAACRSGERLLDSLARKQPNWPTIRRKGECPSSIAAPFSTPDFSGMELTSSGYSAVAPVVLRAEVKGQTGGHSLAKIAAGPSQVGAGLSFKTLWFAAPRYQGPFLIRGTRLDRPGVVRFGESGAASMIAVRGPTLNESKGYREVPGGTFVPGAGCYAFEVDGRGFHYMIVFEVLRNSGLSGKG